MRISPWTEPVKKETRKILFPKKEKNQTEGFQVQFYEFLLCWCSSSSSSVLLSLSLTSHPIPSAARAGVGHFVPHQHPAWKEWRNLSLTGRNGGGTDGISAFLRGSWFFFSSPLSVLGPLWTPDGSSMWGWQWAQSSLSCTRDTPEATKITKGGTFHFPLRFLSAQVTQGPSHKGFKNSEKCSSTQRLSL